jgi:hypothetical protein
MNALAKDSSKRVVNSNQKGVNRVYTIDKASIPIKWGTVNLEEILKP